jgi:hypothetical protein
LAVRVICPKCKAKNCLPDDLDRNTAYQCGTCNAKLGGISSTHFRKAAVLVLIAWCAPAIMILAGVPLTQSAREYSLQSWIGGLLGWSGMILPPFVLLASVFFLLEGFRHWKSTSVSPKGFQALACAVLVGFSACFAAVWVMVRGWPFLTV